MGLEDIGASKLLYQREWSTGELPKRRELYSNETKSEKGQRKRSTGDGMGVHLAQAPDLITWGVTGEGVDSASADQRASTH